MNQFNSSRPIDGPFTAMSSGHPHDDMREFNEHFKEQSEPSKFKLDKKYLKYDWRAVLSHDWNRFTVETIPGTEANDLHHFVVEYPKHPVLRDKKFNPGPSRRSDFRWCNDRDFSHGSVFRDAVIDPNMFDCLLKKPEVEQETPESMGNLNGQEQVASRQDMLQTLKAPVRTSVLGSTSVFLPNPPDVNPFAKFDVVRLGHMAEMVSNGGKKQINLDFGNIGLGCLGNGDFGRPGRNSAVFKTLPYGGSIIKGQGAGFGRLTNRILGISGSFYGSTGINGIGIGELPHSQYRHGFGGGSGIQSTGASGQGEKFKEVADFESLEHEAENSYGIDTGNFAFESQKFENQLRDFNSHGSQISRPLPELPTFTSERYSNRVPELGNLTHRSTIQVNRDQGNGGQNAGAYHFSLDETFGTTQPSQQAIQEFVDWPALPPIHPIFSEYMI